MAKRQSSPNVPEVAVRALVIDYLHALGYTVWAIEQMVHPRPGTPGVPDLYVFKDGFSGWIECKGTKGILRPKQWARGAELGAQKIPCLVARSENDVREWLRACGQQVEKA